MDIALLVCKTVLWGVAIWVIAPLAFFLLVFTLFLIFVGIYAIMDL